VSAPPLVVERVLPASPDEVFAAWTDAAGLCAWMCPGDVLETRAELDVRVGGRFTITMCTAEGEVVHTGIYREIRPPRRLVFTWLSPHTGGVESRVTVELEPTGRGETALRLVHEALPDDEARGKHARGWNAIADGLADFLGRTPTREDTT